MKNFVSVKLMGGLGNYMFQISAAYAISLRDKKEFNCDKFDNFAPHKPYDYYSNNIFGKINFSKLPNFYQLFNEYGFEYNEIPYIPSNIKLVGYFQSEKYFSNYRDQILNLFEIPTNSIKNIIEKYNNLFDLDTCSIHVRRGDYLNLPDHHPIQDISYYQNGVKIIGEDKQYLIFSDDIGWCQKNFDFIQNKTFITDNKDYEDLYLMSRCKNNIIANSSFSWWGSWLNKNENRKVISPKNWFGSKLSHLNTNDLYCKNWIKI